MKSLQEKFDQLRTEVDYVNFIKVELECPLPCMSHQKFFIIAEKLISTWKDICSKYSIAWEEEFIRNYYEEEAGLFFAEDLDEFQRVSENLLRWIEIARAEFSVTTKSLNANMATSSDYLKHFVVKNYDLSSIQKKAVKNNISLFYPETSVELLNDLLLESFDTYYYNLLTTETFRYGVYISKPCGVTYNGNESNYMLFEVNRSTEIAHAYPCEEFEIQRLSIDPKYCDLTHIA